MAKDIDPIFHHTKNLWKYTDVRVESSLVKTWHINPGAPSKEMKDFDYFLEVIDMPAVYQASTGNQHMLLVFRVSDCTVACLGMVTDDPDDVYKALFKTMFGKAKVSGKAVAYPNRCFRSAAWVRAGLPQSRGGRGFHIANVTFDPIWKVSAITTVADVIFRAYDMLPSAADHCLPIKISGEGILDNVRYHYDFGKIYYCTEVEWTFPRATRDCLPDKDAEDELGIQDVVYFDPQYVDFVVKL